MTRRQRRLVSIGSALGVVALAIALALGALEDSIVFFNSPTDLVEKNLAPGTRMRIGGLVKGPGQAARPGLRAEFGSPLLTVAETARGVWVRQLTLENPGR